jgi:hypothetical protein
MDADDSSVELDAEFDLDDEMRPRAHSFVRLMLDLELRPPKGAPDRVRLANDQLNFTVNVLHLRRLAESTRGPVADRVGELDDVREALDTLFANESAPALLHPGAPLVAYLKGLYVFCGTVTEVLEEALSTPTDGRALGWRLAEAAHFYFDGLAPPVRAELTNLRQATEEFREQIEELFFAVSYLHRQLAKMCRSAS